MVRDLIRLINVILMLDVPVMSSLAVSLRNVIYIADLIQFTHPLIPSLKSKE
jgi:hypothetical protein